MDARQVLSHMHKTNFWLILSIIGLLVAICGLFMLLCLPVSLFYGGQDFAALLGSGLSMAILGSLTWYLLKKDVNKELRKREGYLVVCLGWLIMSALGAIPYVSSGAIPAYTDAFFETISGFTTTGATILGPNIEALPKGLHFWRAMTHWIGGMGIIVLTIAILPLLGIGGMQLYAAEVPGPTPDKLTPRIKVTARRLWIIYVSLTLIEALLLMMGGMSLFESLCHAMSTLSTGGFSTRQGSLGDFGMYHQYIIIIFMFLAGVNFSLTFAAIRGNFDKLWKNEEFKTYAVLSILLTLLVSGGIYLQGKMGLEEAFRTGCFQVVSIITTTGFGTADFTAWGPFLMFTFFILMFMGACGGSTSGGIKMIRLIILTKNSFSELRRQIHPNAIIPVRFNGRAIHQDIVSKILAFFIIFILLFFLGSILLSAMGLDFVSAMGATAASLGNIGPGLGIVGPGDIENFAQISPIGKWILSLFMLLGRLEIFTVLILFSPFYWKEK